MSVTVCANGLSVVHQGSGGEANATLPDVCKTSVGKSTVDISYQNSAKSSDLAGGTTTVTADGGNSIAIHGSTFSTSTGDECGDKKGVSSGTIQGEAEFISSSPTVKIEDLGVCRLSDQMTMNDANTMCLGGVQNPSVVVTEDEIGTFTVDIDVSHKSGTKVVNAPFILVDQNGTEFEGKTDATGRATVSGIADGEFNIEMDESENPYRLNNPLIENPLHDEINRLQMFEFLKQDSAFFWHSSNIEQRVWGALGNKTHQCHEIHQIIEYGFKYLSSVVISNKEANTLATALHRQCDPELNEEEAWEHIAFGLLGLTDINGRLYRFCFKASNLYPEDEVLSMLRGMGHGNPVTGIQTIKWDEVVTKSLKTYDDVLSLVINSLDDLSIFASQHGYSGLVEQNDRHINVIKQIKSEGIDLIPDFIHTRADNINQVIG